MIDREKVLKEIEKDRIVAILRGLTAEEAVKTAEAFGAGGLKLIEVTFDQKAGPDYSSTLDAIRGIRALEETGVLVGAGTVLSPTQVDLACDAGAQYIITPNTDPEVILRAVERGMVVISGAMTPSEAVQAYKAGADYVKIFPAEVLGAPYIKAIHAPLSHIPLLAVGGVNENNMKEFLDAGAVGFGIGGNLVRKAWIKAGEYEKLTDLAALYVKNLNAALGNSEE